MSKPSRTTLVRWVNETLSLNYSKVDEFGTGAVYCQLFDSIYGDVPMSRVKFGSRLSLDNEQNYKVLQHVFQQHGISRAFDRQRLMQCRLQDNLDFTQWIYAYWHEYGHLAGYDPVERRNGAAHVPASRASVVRGNGNLVPSNSSTSEAPPMTRNSTSGSSAKISRQNSLTSGSRNQSRNSSINSAVTAASNRSSPLQPGAFGTPQSANTLNSPASEIIEVAVPEVQNIIGENEELRQSVDILLAERDLYYEKLTVIEDLVNAQVDALYSKWGDEAAMDRESDGFFMMMRKLQGILYSRPEGFEPPNQLEEEPF